MVGRKLIGAVLAVSLSTALAGQWLLTRSAAPVVEVGESAVPTRIVSLAPSITEVLFAVGAGDQVVGVTRYCTYPPEAREKADVGGFFDPNFEVIVSLEPDLVVLLPIHGTVRERLESLGLATLVVDHRILPGIVDSLRVVGEAVGRSREAGELVDSLEARVAEIRAMTAGCERPRVMISAGRGKGSGRIEEVYVAGRNEWYDDLVEIAGGVNAYSNDLVQFPTLTAEGLFEVDPDVIVEMTESLESASYTAADVVAEWGTLGELRAVREGRVHVLAGDYTTIPGPRFVLVLEDLARLLHPELEWDAR